MAKGDTGKDKGGGVKDVSGRLRDRKRAQTRKLVLMVAIPVVVLALAAGTVWAVWFSSWFVARSVEVTGNAAVTAEDVVKAAQVGLGTPLVRLDTAAIADRVRQIPVVADASVSTSLSGAVRIQVTERTPVYVIPDNQGWLLVDGTGKGYWHADAVPDGLPTVTIPHDNSGSAQRLMADAATIVAALPPSVRTLMVSMTATTPDDFTIALADGRRIMWGSAGQSDEKAMVIASLLSVDASYYDVSSPSHPATRR